MFAVIKTGGKQYKVVSGDLLTIERVAAEAGEKVQFNDVLMLGGDATTVGTPMIEGAAVQAEVVEQGRGAKVLNFKKRRRKHSSKRLKGHRQYLTTVRVTDILSSGGAETGIKAALGTGVTDALVPALGIVNAATEAAPSETKTTAEPAATEPEVDTAPVEAAVDDTAPESAVADASRPDNLLTEAQGEPDDLTRISGVGPKLLTKLNENGVFHFWQISDWGPSEIAFMDDQLSFKGRIERDNWIAQAKEFAAETEE